MSIDIIGKNGKPILKISDEANGEGDKVILEDGSEVPYNEYAEKREKEIQDAREASKTDQKDSDNNKE